MKLTLAAIFFSGITLLSSCAAIYHPVHPDKLSYSSPVVMDSVSLAYRYDVLLAHGNRKLAKKEIKKGTRVVAMRVTNQSSRPLTFGKDMRLYGNESEVLMRGPAETSRSIRQNAGIYALYFLLTFAKLTVEDGSQRQSYPIGLIIGPGIAISQIAIASSSNKRFKAELLAFNLVNKTIQPGETVYGLVGLNTPGVLPLTARVK